MGILTTEKDPRIGLGNAHAPFDDDAPGMAFD
jgi:hypothetical protein